MVLVRVTPVRKEPKKNPNGTGCFDVNGKEIEYGQTIKLTGINSHFRFNMGNLEFVAGNSGEFVVERSDGVEHGFFTKIYDREIFFAPREEPYQYLEVVEPYTYTGCVDAAIRPIIVGQEIIIKNELTDFKVVKTVVCALPGNHRGFYAKIDGGEIVYNHDLWESDGKACTDCFTIE